MKELNNCDTREKEANRQVLCDWFRSNLKNKDLSKIKVACLPGPNILEITNLYDKLGVLRRNIYAFTNDDKEYDDFCQVRSINPIKGNIFDAETGAVTAHTLMKSGFIKERSCLRPNKISFKFFDIIYFDLYSNLNSSAFACISYFIKFFIKSGGIGGLSFYAAREKDKQFKKYLNYNTEKGVNLAPDYEKSNFVLQKLLSGIGNKGKGNGFYATNVIKTKYIANRIPMITVLCKIRSLRQIGIIKRKQIWLDSIARFCVNPLIEVKLAENGVTELNEKERYVEPKKVKTKHKKRKKITVRNKVKEDIIAFLKEGIPDNEIIECYNIKTQQLAAYKAHITMGTYA